MNYHAHIYWKNDAERNIALALRPELQSLGCGLGRVHDRAIGPHPLPMYQVMYDSSKQLEVEGFLRAMTSSSVLLHEDIGFDHVKDHTEGTRWIGEPLELDIEFLKNFQDES